MAAYRRFAAKGVFVTPTLNGSRIIAYLDRDDHSQHEDLAYIGPNLRKTYDWRIEHAAKSDAAGIPARLKQIEAVSTILTMPADTRLSQNPGTKAGLCNRFTTR